MNFVKKARGILGINSRNLNYISRYNTAVGKKFADNKIFSKQFLESRGIGVAKLYRTIKNYTQLTTDFFNSLPDSFVVKPNKGFGGGGILVIKKSQGEEWITASDHKINREFLYRHCIEILDGKYSISGVDDTVIFEEKLEPHPEFRKLTDIGLPDIRVVVFNNVPVLAMIRVPTYESEGKANMEIGAIALGIDIGTGRTTGGAQYGKFVKKLPNGHSTAGFKVPFWDEVLLTAAKVQNSAKIGFIGVDLSITRTGVKVLEVNARSGLKIQIANKIPLKTRLEKVADLKVLTPEDGVEIAKTLFSQGTKQSSSEEMLSKPVIGIEESVILNSEKPKTIKARVDLGAETNIINSALYSGSILDVSIRGKRIKLPVEKGEVQNADLILAGRFLIDFYIDPNKRLIQPIPGLVQAQLDEKMIRNIDEKLCELDSQIKLLSYINPRNLAEQQALFLANPEFSPRFFYRECDLDLDAMRRELKRLPEVEHFLAPLFEAKSREIEQKLDLIESVGMRNFGNCSQNLFGGTTERVYKSALDFLKKYEKKVKPDKSREMEVKEAEGLLVDFLKKHKLSHWKIKIMEDTVSDIQVTKHHVILLKKDAVFKENRLKALLVHEIGTHVFRFENGKLQPFRIFERGTAGYLQVEEGLAIWNQNQLGLDLGDKFLTPAYQIIAIHLAKKMSFCDLFQYLRHTYDLSDELAWKLCIKCKRGFKDTASIGAFTKDALYFLGHQEVESFFKKKGKREDLYVGKIAIDDLKLVKKIKGLKPAKFLL